MHHWYLSRPEYESHLDQAHQQRAEAVSRAAYQAVVGIEWVARKLARAFATAARRTAGGYAAWQSQRRTVLALARLDDRMLRDVGIDPGSIDAVAADLVRRKAQESSREESPVRSRSPVSPLRPVVPLLRLDLECPEPCLAA